MIKNKNIILVMSFLLVSILMLGNVLAFAVSSKYWEENPLTINPGETQEAYIVLQNMAGTEPVSAKVNILEGSEIATMNEPDKVYEIPVGERIEVYFTVTVPLETQIGGNYNLIFDVSSVSQEAGAMTFGSGMQKLIPVLVTAVPQKEVKVSSWIYYLIAGVILLLIIILIVLKIKKKK